MQRLACVLLAVFVAAFGIGCATTGVNRGQTDLISLQEEWDLGAKLAQDLDSQLAIVHDREAEAYLNSIGQQIVAQTQMNDLPWHFHLVDDPNVSVFNIPGGHVYMDTGLIGEAADLSEMVGVLSHEIGHAVARHGTGQLTKQYGISVVGSLVLGNNPKVYRQILAKFVATGSMKAFSRDDEEEADKLGVKYMYDAGYDPEGMVDMFRMLLERRQSEPSELEQFFSIHPLTEEGMSYTERKISKLPRKRDLVMNTSAYQAFRNRLESLAQNQK